MSQTSHNTSSSLSSAGTVSSMETLPAQDVVDGYFDEHEEADDNPEIVWGRLLPVGKTFLAVDLKETKEETKDEYVFGRDSSCDVPYNTALMVNNPCFQAISKRHFRIYKENNGTTVFVFIEDYSSNGTFVNGEKIGKGNKSILKNNDEIALSLAKNKAYVFMDSNDTEQDNLPEEMRQKYIMSKVLGRGACGLVRLAFRKGSCLKFAVKIIEKKTFSIGGSMLSNMEKTVMEEVNILKSLNHPCIIGIEDVCHTDDRLYIVLELVEGGELFDRVVSVRKFDEMTGKVLFYQMLLATKYLHDNGITHRDLKPENILLSNDDTHTLIKVTDFGLSKFLGEQSLMQTLCGTPTYLAPEVLTNSGGRSGYGKSVDCWSLGVILFICLGGYPPFTEEVTVMPLDEQIKRGFYSFPSKFWKGVSDEAMDLIKKLLTVDSRRRYTVTQALEHSWLRDTSMREIVDNLMYPPSKKMPPPQIKLISKKRQREKSSDDINDDDTNGNKTAKLSNSSDDASMNSN